MAERADLVFWAWQKHGLTAYQKYVLVCIAYLCRWRGHTTATQVAQYTALSLRTVQRALRYLGEAGYTYMAPAVSREALGTLEGLGNGVKCQWCAADFALLELHHLVPVSDGGTDCASNLAWLCPNCHALAHQDVVKVNPLEKI